MGRRGYYRDPGTPAKPNPSMPGIHIPIAFNIDKDNADGQPIGVTARQEESKARRMYLKVDDFETMCTQRDVKVATERRQAAWNQCRTQRLVERERKKP